MFSPEPNTMDQHWTSSGDPLADLTAFTEQAVSILIVDDDPVVRTIMRATLEDDGFAVIEAEDGLSACRQSAEMVPSLLVVDAMMPNMDGFELCRALRQQPETQHIP